MRENRSSGSEGGEPQLNAACLPLSLTFVGWVLTSSTALTNDFAANSHTTPVFEFSARTFKVQ